MSDRLRKLFAGGKNMMRAPVLGATLWLVACGGGAGGEDSGENPDPAVQDYGVAYVKRPMPVDEQGDLVQDDARDPSAFHAGGDLYYRERALPSAEEKNITSSLTGGRGDVKDLEVSYDGNKVVFALRMPEIEGLPDDEQPTWNIWEYDIQTDRLRRVISADIQAEAGQDVAPHYLPDGRIIFSSTRQRRTKAILLDENKPQFTLLNEDRNGAAFMLHVMNADGTEIQQVSFNQSSDLDPMVLSNGKVVFSRWDNMGSRNQISLYRMNPDGTDLQVLYGAHSHATGSDGAIVQFMQPRELPDGQIMSVLRPFTGTFDGGDLIRIDSANYVDNSQPTASNQGILTANAQESVTLPNVRSDTAISAGGRFRAAFPLWDGTNRLLVSWSPCRLIETDGRIIPCTDSLLAAGVLQEAPPLYGLYILNMANNTQQPLFRPEEGMVFSEVVAAQDRALPPLYDWQRSASKDQQLADAELGVLHIRSVYDFDGTFSDLGSSASVTSPADLADPAQATADQRPAHFLRIVKAAAVPERVPGSTFGRSRAQLMREIIAYAPVEPDGSVKVAVPADVPLVISVLDKAGRRIGPRHQNWLQVRPGETRTCNGCHDHSNGSAHGRVDAANAVNVGATVGAGLPFPNTEAAWWVDEIGETMAEVRTRLDPTVLMPSVDLVYEDVWTDAAVRAKDANFSYLYDDLTTAAPVSQDCQTTWNSRCRIIINYETHIHPLWNTSRIVVDTDGVTVLADNTCTNCHSTRFNNVTQVPGGQLDLTDGASNDQPLHYSAYRELLYNDTELELVGGALQERLVPALDVDGNTIMVPVNVPPSMSTASARNSYFMEKMNEQELSAGRSLTAVTDPEYVNHAGMLSDAELRLIAEWLDIGGQYYNNSYDAP